MIQILVNNEVTEVKVGTTLADLLNSLGIGSVKFGIAAAINGDLVDLSEWPKRILNAGEKVEIVRAFQGG